MKYEYGASVNDTQEIIEVIGEENVPVPPQIPHGLIWNQTSASVVKGQ
jgi:hypothetical protein